MKHATEMTPAEYRAALAEVLRKPPRGLSAAEQADLASRREEDPAKAVREMTPDEFAKARARAICAKY